MIGAYLKAFLVRYANDAWQAVAPGAGDIVKNVFTHDPEQYVFSVAHLPALYLFRESSAKVADQTTADLRVFDDKVKLFWVLPPAGQIPQAGRARAVMRVGALIDAALRRGRDPSYVVEGDPDTGATTYGSVVIRHAGLMQLEGGTRRSGRIGIKPPGNTKQEPAWNVGLYDCLMMELRLREAFEETPGVNGPDDLGPYFTDPPARVKATITPNGADDAAVEYRDPKIVF